MQQSYYLELNCFNAFQCKTYENQTIINKKRAKFQQLGSLIKIVLSDII